MTNDQKWQACLHHYGKAPFESFKTKVVVRPSDAKVDLLYAEMMKFHESIEKLKSQQEEAVRRFVNWKFNRGPRERR